MKNETKFHIPFFDSAKYVLEEYGISDIEREDVQLNKALTMNYEVNVVVGLTGDIRGTVGLSLPQGTAINLAYQALQEKASDKEGKLNRKAKDFIGEVIRKIALTGIDKVAVQGKEVEASPPTLVVGEELHIVISQVHTVSLLINSSVGEMQINVCLEGVH